MRRGVLVAVAVVLFIGGLVFALNRPEPTPAERLDKAAKDAAESIREASDAVSDAVTTAKESLAKEVEKTSSELSDSMAASAALMAEEIASSADRTKDRLQAFLAEWKASGIITDAGIDFDAAIEAVDESDLSDEAKARAKTILVALRDAPGAFEARLAKLEADLSN
jgi:hypothetical protein